ncbi:MAG: hypothetical protein NDP13_01300 [Crenarchaeota archaeon]|nr:hypothetical protein [Thermoproteota archaeon]
MGEREGSLYGWAFKAGKKIMEIFESMYGAERAEKKMKSLLLTLRSESLPERFKRSIIDCLIEAEPDVNIPEEVKLEKRWRTDEFYYYSTAILSGFFDALNSWRRKREERKEEGGDEHAE